MEIKSTRIKSADYNDSTEVLTISFVKGGVYKYYRVPESIYKGIIASSSPGNYLDTFIKPKFMCKKA
jgi:hypothetical protein